MNVAQSIDTIIDNYPIEILKLIFESACPRNYEGFKTATNISHVCYRWRSISLSTPRLWSYIHIRLSDPPKETNAFIVRTVERIKAIPVMVTIYDDSISALSRIGLCELSRILAIDKLKVHITTTSLQANWSLLELAFRHVKYNITDIATIYKHTPVSGWECANLLSHFPRVSNVFFDGPRISFWSPSVFQNIRGLVLRDVYLSLEKLIVAFPQLEYLEIASSHIRSDPYAEISILPSLKVLKHKNTIIEFPNDRKICPVLAEYWCDRISENTKFIELNSQITTLRVRYGRYGEAGLALISLSSHVSQLQHLTVPYCYKLIRIPGKDSHIHFPHLRTLTIHDLHGALSASEFNALVQARCLPRTHPHSKLLKGCEPLQELGILMKKALSSSYAEWKWSDFYKEAERRISDDEESSIRLRIGMSWSRRQV